MTENLQDLKTECHHQCSGNCRRVGCNCECGEFHELDKNSVRVFSIEQLKQIEELKAGEECSN
jgi:hypothetical protein